MHEPPAQPGAPRADWPWTLILLAVAAGGMWATRDVGFQDTGDFMRSIGFMLSGPVGQQEYRFGGEWWPRWSFRADPGSPFEVSSLSALHFYALGALQRLFHDVYDLRIAGLLSKVLVAAAVLLIARTLAARQGVPGPVAYGAGLLLLALLFSTHNAAFFHGFYQEHTFLVFAPLLVLGLLHLGSLPGRLLMVVAVLFMAGSKTQYFYLPALLLVVYAWGRLASRRRVSLGLVAALAAVQVLTLSPVKENPFKDVNYYHSLYFGSYLLLAPDELATIEGVRRDCVGVERWGNVYRPDTREVFWTPRTDCPREGELGLADVLRPWLRYPALFLRVWRRPVSDHVTVDYFHVLFDNRFVEHPRDARADGRGPAAAGFLSGMRERLLSPVLWATLPLGVLFLALTPRDPRLAGMQAAGAFFALTAFSQFYVSLLGEGLRDLSTHLAAAQISFDLAVVIALALAATAVARRLARRVVAVPEAG